jgi:hypothetical protein
MKVYSVLWDNFDEQINRLPISRDQFLNRVLRMETPRLAEAMAGKKLSGKANRWISSQLTRLGTKTINIGVDKEVARDLNEVVHKSHLVRDAFFNRLIVLLRSSDKFLDQLELPKYEDGSVGKEYGKTIAKPVSPLSALGDIFEDPLWYLHMAAQEIHETSLYLLPFFSSKLDGFACWINDEMVPGTRANRHQQRELDELVRSLGEFEESAYSSTRLK